MDRNITSLWRRLDQNSDVTLWRKVGVTWGVIATEMRRCYIVSACPATSLWCNTRAHFRRCFDETATKFWRRFDIEPTSYTHWGRWWYWKCRHNACTLYFSFGKTFRPFQLTLLSELCEWINVYQIRDITRDGNHLPSLKLAMLLNISLRQGVEAASSDFLLDYTF